MAHNLADYWAAPASLVLLSRIYQRNTTVTNAVNLGWFSLVLKSAWLYYVVHSRLHRPQNFSVFVFVWNSYWNNIFLTFFTRQTKVAWLGTDVRLKFTIYICSLGFLVICIVFLYCTHRIYEYKRYNLNPKLRFLPANPNGIEDSRET